MVDHPVDALDRARRSAALSHVELWIRYFELGGSCPPVEVEAYVYGLIQPCAHDHDLLAHALNERFLELGNDRPVPYSDELGL